jgi:hypothetical protein
MQQCDHTSCTAACRTIEMCYFLKEAWHTSYDLI